MTETEVFVMAVFRIEKSKDFTIMSNHHLRNTTLSLKAKGLQSLMLSLPEEWDYSLKGLAKICKDGVESIGTALQELERHGYLTRRQLRDDKGKYLDLEYTIHEIPVAIDDALLENKAPKPDYPYPTCPQPGNPDTDNPDSDKPDSGHHAQLNTKDQVLKNQNIHGSSIHQSIGADAPGEAMDAMDAMDIYREVLKKNIDYDILCQDRHVSRDEIEEILELMLETVCSKKKTIRIGGEDKPAEVVKSRMMKLNQFHIEYVLETLSNNTTDVRNIKSYLLTTLFNAPATIGNYYKSRVNHDLYGT
jgi:hypothetical protein